MMLQKKRWSKDMLKVLSFIALGIIISVLEVPKMKKQSLNKEIVIYIFLLITGLGLLSLISLDVKVPSSSTAIRYILSPVDKILSKIL